MQRLATKRRAAWMLAAAAMAALPAFPVLALDRLDFSVAADEPRLEKKLRAASLLLSQQADGLTNPQDLFAAARADYARILTVLYAEGYFSAAIHISLDGREAAEIAPLNAPDQINLVTVAVDPGPRFAFSSTKIAPLAPDTLLPESFWPGKPATTGVVQETVDAAILGWRDIGHAKARVQNDDLVADHARATLSANILLNPGPALRFGTVTVTGAERMEEPRILKIAGLKRGEAFSQAEMDRAASRLRRSGVFSSVTLTEGENLENGDLLPIAIAVAEQKRRRYSFGAEIASLDGLSMSGYWLHRNLLHGGERFKLDLSVTNIGANSSGVDYSLGITLDRPATLSADTTGSLTAAIGHLDEIDYAADFAEFGLSFRHYFSEELTASLGLSYAYSEGRDPGGSFRFRNLSLPASITWDRRDNPTDARDDFYIDAKVKPFLGFGTTGSGVRVTLDARGYRSFADDRVTLALRLQGGAILGSGLLDTPRNDLFFSGGGGTVRGQPYRSLGIAVTRGSGPSFLIGGTHLLVGSAEIRARVTERIGVVGFADVGRVGVDGFFDSLGDWHAGAGLGLRYETGFGPIRFDVAAPVHGKTGDGVQLYLGLGQSF